MSYSEEEIKKLGFGLMRLPQKDGAIDVEQPKMQPGSTARPEKRSLLS